MSEVETVRSGLKFTRRVAHLQCGGDASGNGDCEFHFLAYAFPVALDKSAHRLIFRLGPVEVRDKVRTDNDVRESGAVLIQIDTGKVVDHPCGNIAEKHVVIRRVAEVGEQVPLFAQRIESL